MVGEETLKIKFRNHRGKMWGPKAILCYFGQTAWEICKVVWDHGIVQELMVRKVHKFRLKTSNVNIGWVGMMGQTPFYRSLNKLEHHFLNIERTQLCSSIGDRGDRTRSPYFWLRTIEHRTLNLIGLSLDLLNYSWNWLEYHFFEIRMDLNVFK